MFEWVHIAVARAYRALAMRGVMAAMLASALGMSVARAQQIPAEDEFAPLGLRTGSFILYPQIELRGGYTDNAQRQAGNSDAAAVASLRAGIDLRSDWSRHEAALSMRGSYTGYAGHSDLADASFGVDASGRFELGGDFEIAPRANYRLLSQDRVEDHELGVALSLVQRFNRLALRLTAGIEDFIYGARTSDLGSTARNDVADYAQSSLALRASYEISPDMETFAEGRFNDRHFDQRLDVSGTLRGSQGYAMLIGTSLSNGSKLRGSVAAGYQVQIPDAAALDEISALAFEADLVWDISALTRLRATAESNIGETTLAGSAGYTGYRAGLDLRHELRRNLIVTSSLTYSRSDYAQSTLLEQSYEAGLGLEYMLNRSMALTADLSYLAFKSTAARANYEATTLMLGVRLRQ